jgi:hypothetical protein
MSLFAIIFESVEGDKQKMFTAACKPLPDISLLVE